MIHSDRPFKLAVFDSKKYQEVVFKEINLKFNYDIEFIEEKLTEDTVHLAFGADAVCVFVHDSVSLPVAQALTNNGIHLAVYRCAGYDTCNVEACEKVGLSVARVPGYSPNAIAEHACALMLALNRRLIQANTRVHMNDFSLDGLTGFTMAGKTVGVIGTGRIGFCLVKIMLGFGCNVVCYDTYQSDAIKQLDNVKYVSLDELYACSDIISLHCLLDESSKHMIDACAFNKMKDGVIIVNTARGPLIDTKALVAGLRSGKVGAAGLDVVEGECAYFYENMSEKMVLDDNLSLLLSFQNKVLITAHQAYLTKEALGEIARTTLENVAEFIAGKRMREIKNHVFPNKK